MRLPFVLATLAAAVVPGCLPSADLSCDCRLWHLRHWSFNMHCIRRKGGASNISCLKADLLDIPHGYHYVPGYALIKLYRTMKPWPEAKKACEAEGAYLAVPRDRYAFDGLKQIFYKVKGVGWGNLGITDHSSEGVFVGLDGRPLSYIPWISGQPDNTGDNENCVDYNSAGVSNDVKCSDPAPYFCERPLPAAIPEGYAWVGEAGRFYKLHHEKKVYAEAARVCRAENAQLAVPDTWRRGEALITQFDLDVDGYATYFIGFTDEATEGDFVTETGRHLSDMEFQIWGANETINNDKGKSKNCLGLSKRGYYADVRCDRALAFVCEILPI